jgi:hypothetical protein
MVLVLTNPIRRSRPNRLHQNARLSFRSREGFSEEDHDREADAIALSACPVCGIVLRGRSIALLEPRRS